MTEHTAVDDVAELVRRARAGDHRAWTALFHRFRGMLTAVARSYRLTAGDVDDVVQTTWLRLYESIDRLRRPECLPGWLSTTARRESLRLLRATAREAPSEALAAVPDEGHLPAPGEELLTREAESILRAAVRELPAVQRRLLDTLLTTAAPSYADVARSLDMPIGSIGPTRARGIDALRRDPRIAALAG